jgi:hypothetical protein
VSPGGLPRQGFYFEVRSTGTANFDVYIVATWAYTAP